MAQNTARVPMEVTYQPAWLTWVAATTSCLRALGVPCDTADVAGMSGYAFHFCVHSEVCPSGPTVLDWNQLHAGVQHLGRSVLCFHSNECHTGKFVNERTRASCRAAFEVAKREVEAGRPCVIWGAYVPEFAACWGVQDGAYLVKSFKECLRQEQPPIPCEQLEAPGGPYVLGFPTAVEFPQTRRDRYAVWNAVRLFRTRRSGGHTYGQEAYAMWCDALQSKRAGAFGNSYNAACYAEGRHFAREFISRLAKRNAFAAQPLTEAAECYARAAKSVDVLTRLFPFPQQGEKVADAAKIAEAVAALRDAEAAECRAMELIEQVSRQPWPAV